MFQLLINYGGSGEFFLALIPTFLEIVTSLTSAAAESVYAMYK